MDEYMRAYHSNPEELLCLLCVGVTHLNQALNRRVPDRDAAVLAAFAFLQVPSQCPHCTCTSCVSSRHSDGAY